MKIPWKPLIEAINLEPFISANFRHGPDVFAGDRGEGIGLGGLAVEPLRIKAGK
jgi:hypothetical protein